MIETYKKLAAFQENSKFHRQITAKLKIFAMQNSRIILKHVSDRLSVLF